MKKIIVIITSLIVFTLLTFNLPIVDTKEEPEVTFIELGSVRCIPCQKMQPVMKQVEKNYPNQVHVIFYDVWTEEGKKAAKNFDFNEIPTQIFLDKEGNEFARHVGYFPYEDLEKILKQKIK